MLNWLDRGSGLIAAILAIAGSSLLIVGFSQRDVLHVYSDSSVSNVYEVSESGLAPFGNNYFPRVASRGRMPVSFPLSSRMAQFRLRPGDKAVPISILRVCLERTPFVTHCSDGSALPADIALAHDAAVSVRGTALVMACKTANPYLDFKPALLQHLRPSLDIPLILVRALFAPAAAAFFFCFFYSWIAPLAASWNRDCTSTLLASLAIRAVFFSTHQGGAASDSLLFENYLPQHLFILPGIRGLVYPAFLTLFPPRGTSLFVTQLLLGALGSVIVLVLLRSLKKASPWDIVLAVAATSLPTLLAMELIVLSESFSLFLVLAALLAFRYCQLHGVRAVTAAGMGVTCALLYNTKPQFGFMIALFALALLLPKLLSIKLRSIRGLLAFAAPVLAMELFVIGINFSAGNFPGVTSTLGYSLFDHAQKFLVCPSTDPDLRIQYFCNARAALPPNGNPTGYTAWVIYPAMHGQQQPFHEATAGYASLSFRLIAAHPLGYLASAARSFWDFWVDDVPMVPGVWGGGSAKWILPLDRLVRHAIAICFFLSLFVFLFKRVWHQQDLLVFCLLLIFTLLGSAVVQALAESGNEQARFAVPTMPLPLIAIAWLLAIAFQEFRLPAKTAVLRSK